MMRSILHLVVTLALAAGLLVAGVAEASAGVRMAAAEGQTQVVICGAEGAALVTLDAKGHASKPAKDMTNCRNCAACVLSAMGPIPEHAALIRPAARVSEVRHKSFITAVPSLFAGLPLARAPPVGAQL